MHQITPKKTRCALIHLKKESMEDRSPKTPSRYSRNEAMKKSE